MTTASAPGKIILLGEHTALYGNPVLAAAVSLRATVSARKNDKLTVSAPGLIDGAPERRKRLGLAMVKKAAELVAGGYDLTVESEIPLASGMGSSASIASAMVAAMRAEKNLPFDKKAIAETAWRCEDMVHSKSSGVDPFAATYGSIIFYRMGEAEVLRPKSLPSIVVAHTGITSDTGDIVRYVNERKQDSKSFEGFLERSKDLVDRGKTSIENGDMKALGKLMGENHALLSDLGVSSEELDVLVNAARRAGAYGAKLCGAGRGGIMAALVGEKAREPVAKALSKAGGKIIQTTISSEGVRLD